MGNIGTWQLVIVLVIILLLFGAKRLPAMAKGLGESLQVFKKETQGLTGDHDEKSSAGAPPRPAIDQQPVDSAEPVTNDQPQREA
jgi:sec-independent protein translocase protein TatA